MNSPINQDLKRLEQCGKDFLAKLASKVNMAIAADRENSKANAILPTLEAVHQSPNFHTFSAALLNNHSLSESVRKSRCVLNISSAGRYPTPLSTPGKFVPHINRSGPKASYRRRNVGNVSSCGYGSFDLWDWGVNFT